MKCLNCQKPTKKWGNRFVKYCGYYCKNEYHKGQKRKTFDKVNCLICEKKFTPKSKVNKVCSPYCKYQKELQERSKKPKTKDCKVCKKEFKPYTSLDKYCSFQCRDKNKKLKRSFNWSKESVEKRKGKNNPSYKHGLRCQGKKQDSTGNREYLRNRHIWLSKKYEEKGYLNCEECGVTNTILECHHLIYRSEKPNHKHLHDERNFLLLCVPCHNKYHIQKSIRNNIVKERRLNELFGEDVLNK